jgi:hypothetical protein
MLRAVDRTFRALPSRLLEGGLFALAWAAAPVVETALGAFGLKRTLHRLDRIPRAGRILDGAALELATARAYRAHPWLAGKCLERSLLQYALQRVAGPPPKLVIGVRREADAPLDAHAWIEPRATPETRYTHVFTWESP